MPTILNARADGIFIGGQTFSAFAVRRFLIGTGTITVFLVLLYIVLVLSPKMAGWVRRRKSSLDETTTSVRVHLKRPAAARLRPDITLPQSPVAPHLRPSALAALPKALTTRPISRVYRYSAHWLSGRKPSGPPQIVHTRPGDYQRRQVSLHFAGQAVCHQVGSEVPSSPERSLALRESAVHLYQVADVVVGAHPHVRLLPERATPADHQLSFPWLSSSSVGADFRFGLAHTLDLTPAPVSPVRVKVSSLQPEDPSPTAHFRWGTVIHTLEQPLRGNKMQRAPFGRSGKHNVKTNVVFAKTSPFHAPSAADKENAYGSPAAVRALA